MTTVDYVASRSLQGRFKVDYSRRAVGKAKIA
jgi:hypothetical protein